MKDPVVKTKKPIIIFYVNSLIKGNMIIFLYKLLKKSKDFILWPKVFQVKAYDINLIYISM